MAKKKKVEVGQKVRFDPFETAYGFGVDAIRGEVTGTVAEVYKDHKWFSVVFGDPQQRMSFKFCDIGERVMIVG
jgi:hypothetical protein